MLFLPTFLQIRALHDQRKSCADQRSLHMAIHQVPTNPVRFQSFLQVLEHQHGLVSMHECLWWT